MHIPVIFNKPSSYHRDSDPGYVYLVQSQTHVKHYKIGKSKDPSDRLRLFEVKMPFDIEIQHVIPCYQMSKLEFELHHFFRNKRVKGEWFRLDDAEVTFIKLCEDQLDFDSMIPAADRNWTFYLRGVPRTYRGVELHGILTGWRDVYNRYKPFSDPLSASSPWLQFRSIWNERLGVPLQISAAATTGEEAT